MQTFQYAACFLLISNCSIFLLIGESERLIGKFWKKLSPEQKDGVLIATKYCPLPWHFNARKTLITTLKESLDRLQLEQVDLFQVVN